MDGAQGRMWALLALLALGVSSPVQAQPRAARTQLPWTGYELALDGSRVVRSGRTARYRGVAYRVRGLSELVPDATRVRARVNVEQGQAGPWVEVRSDSRGRFEIEVAVPEIPAPQWNEEGLTLQVEVGPADEARRFESPIRVSRGARLVLRTDRNLYEAGEPVHVWAWLVDEASRRPIEGQSITLVVEGEPLSPGRHEITTGPSGVAHLELQVPEPGAEGRVEVRALIPGQVGGRASFEVGTRTLAGLLATVEIEPRPVAPGGDAVAVVTATDMSGAPIAGARVRAQIEQTSWTGTTDASGVARIQVSAPTYAVHETGVIPVEVQVFHAGHDALSIHGTLRLAVPLALSVEVVARHGGLVPEIDDVLYVWLHDGVGDPPTQPTQITVSGPAVRGGRAEATTDANGLAVVPARLPVGSASANRGAPETSVLVEIAGPLERLARVTIPVFRHAEVVPTLSQPVAAPGDRLTVQLHRRASASRRDVVLELLDDRSEVLGVVWPTPRQSSVDIDLPVDRIGLLTLRARAVHADETLEGVGGLARLIVRPSNLDFVSVDPIRSRYAVGETARVRLTTGAGGPRRWAAVLVRDLAAHAGEFAFNHHFLSRRFDQALLEASGEAERRLVQAALAGSLSADAAPRRSPPLVDALGMESSGRFRGPRGIRDPWPLARELERRGTADAMFDLEYRLGQALQSNGLDALTTTSPGGRRVFREDALQEMTEALTLGGAGMTPALLEASDPAFTYDNVAGRVARARLVHLMTLLAAFLDPGDDASPAARMAAREPSDRWLPRMVEQGLLGANELDDPWGHRFVLRRVRTPVLVLSRYATNVELVSPGPDGRLGTSDDVRDPFQRVVPARTPYAVASGEDTLMRQLSVLSPVAGTLSAIAESYARVSAEMSEDVIGDAVAAQVSEGAFGVSGLGLIGTGGGGGGSGYGRGAGGLRGRRSSVRRSSTGSAVGSSLANVLRERFPPTLLFVPSLELDASGTTEIPIALADAVTTYLVEVIVWREDGWSWSDSTRIEVAREVVIAAPVPGVAHVGDQLLLPVRVVNHGDTARDLQVRMTGSRVLGVDDAPARSVTVGARDAVAIEVPLQPSRVGAATIEFAVLTPSGEALDAVRLPMRVAPIARHVTRREQSLAAGVATMELTVPPGATVRGGDVRLTVGDSLFQAFHDDERWIAWSPPSGGPRASSSRWHSESVRRSPIWLAFAIGAAWSREEVEDAEIEEELDRLTGMLERRGRSRTSERRWLVSAVPDPDGDYVAGWALLGLRQIVESPGRRQLPRALELVERLRREVGSAALSASDPGAWVLGAAALGWTSSAGDLDRTRELLRRLARHTVTIGEDHWLPLEVHAIRGTVLWAMAEVALGHRAVAFSILRTVSRWIEANWVSGDVRGLARAATSRMMRGATPENVTLTIDGVEQTVELSGGGARIDARELASPGRHVIVVDAGHEAPISVHARARFGVAWSAPPQAIESRRPLVISLTGGVGDLAHRGEFELVVRNRAPSTLRQPVVQIQLPTGASVPWDVLRRLRHAGYDSEQNDDLFTIRLPAMRPGNELRIPIEVRWTVTGNLRGFGLSGWDEDRPEAVTVIAPRAVVIEGVAR